MPSMHTKDPDFRAGDARRPLSKIRWQEDQSGSVLHVRKDQMPEYEAILILSFGGPESKEDVIPFLKNVTAGKNIPLERLQEVAAQYDLFDGVSPINQQNRDFISVLEEELRQHDLNQPIYFGNRNWEPFLQDTVNQIVEDGHRKILTFVTSAFGSYSGCRQYQEDIDRAIQNTQVENLTIDKIRLFWNHPKFLSAVASRIETTMKDVPDANRPHTKLLFTAHSIPKAWEKTSPYTSQLLAISNEISQRVAPDLQWDLVYQSRSGPPAVPWLEPDIVDHLDEIDTEKISTVVVVPIGFLSDHMEVKFDLDTQAANHAREIGIQMLRVPTVGLHKTFITMTKELIEEAIEEMKPIAEIGTPWICSPECCAINTKPGARRPNRES
ncbi:MAG: ferrochelatase [Acidimicrobiaceae bacterium]|nr:ferrochelatase [Acidimicrobiaceae bacterium]